VREDLGLVYTIFASVTPFRDCGYFNIYAGASTDQMAGTIAATMKELRRIKKKGVPAGELRRNQDQLKASLILNLESSSSRMSSLAQQEMNFGAFLSPDETIARVDAVTADELRRLANEIFQTEAMAAVLLGPLGKFKLERSQLAC
jgi:predicted Zn-dependent peptidase